MRVDDGVARFVGRKWPRHDVLRFDGPATLDQTADKAAKILFVVLAAQFSRDGGVVLENKATDDGQQVTARVQPAKYAVDLLRQFVAAVRRGKLQERPM